MKIADSAIQLSSQHSYQEIYKKSESLTFWDNRAKGIANGWGKGGQGLDGTRNKDAQAASLVDLSSAAKRTRHHRGEIPPISEEDKNTADLNLRILAALIERLTGRKIDITLPEEAPTETVDPGLNQGAGEVSQGGQNVQGYGLIYDYYESYSEAETTAFSATGVVHTADGKEIDFSAQLNMSRQFMVEKNINIKAGDALKDPLMLNFSGSAAEISKRDFNFDIDSDGIKDQISFAGAQSGFLALDRNNDGTINNGTELFGPATGNGFSELAAFDSDGNNWIDENDPIYDRLRIWMKTDDGQDQLFALGEKGVGAIYLNHIATPFSVKDSNNELLGQVRESGIFLGEDGGVGTIQQIDLAI
jgi:hypothetical protein